MAKLGVLIGSSPMSDQEALPQVDTVTPWGEVSAAPTRFNSANNELLLLRRHGADGQINPHQINYRANLWLLKNLGVDALVGTHTVGSIDPSLEVGDLVLPEQIIDYTWGRAQTYDDRRRHVEFSQPYDDGLRQLFLSVDATMVDGGVYGCTQGPRLETAAEIARMAKDGCTLVGMTAMPEAGLARELDLPYVSICLVVNPAAGVAGDAIDLEALRAASNTGAERIFAALKLLEGF